MYVLVPFFFFLYFYSISASAQKLFNAAASRPYGPPIHPRLELKRDTDSSESTGTVCFLLYTKLHFPSFLFIHIPTSYCILYFCLSDIYKITYAYMYCTHDTYRTV